MTLTLTQEWMNAVEAGDVAAAAAALERGVDVNAYESGRTALSAAARKGNVDMIDFLTEHGAKLDFSDITTGCGPLHAAIMFGRKDAVLRLIELGANVNAQTVSGATPLLIAVAQYKPDLVKALLEHGADPTLANHNGGTPLAIARRDGADSCAALLMGAIQRQERLRAEEEARNRTLRVQSRLSARARRQPGPAMGGAHG